MRKRKSRDLADKTCTLDKKELKELEKLEETFGKCSEKIIKGNEVYGIIEGKKEYLGTKSEYENYRRLKSHKYGKNSRQSSGRFERYNNFNMD